MAEGNKLFRILGFIWHGFDGIRKFLHLLVLLVIFGAVIGVVSSSVPELSSKAALVIDPEGFLVDELEGDPMSRALAEIQGNPVQQTLVRDITEALDWAADDERIHAAVLDLDALLGGGPTKLRAVARAVERFKGSGKPVYALGSSFSQQGYYIAAHADEIWLNDDGGVLLNGYGLYKNYYKGAIDKLAIDWNIFRVGTHKAFAEPFLRNDMSDEDRSSSELWLNDLWDQYRSDIATARGIDTAVLDELVNNLDRKLSESDDSLAEIALNANLVDKLSSRPDMNSELIELVGESRSHKGRFSEIRLDDYVASQKLMNPENVSGSANIAVVVAAGPVVDGSAPPGQIGGDSTADLIRTARTDDTVKALVLRVDTGGGSVSATHVIAEELAAFKATGRPIVASMGSVAASAGYWISATADKIYAQPTTITGSIGVVGMFPTFQNSLNKLGISTDGVGTTELAGQFRADRALSDQARTIIQQLVNRTYDSFITGVAEHRGMEKSAINEIAQGKVWSGEDAREIGLVDEFGDIDAAIAAASDLASIGDTDYGVKYIRQELTPTQQLFLQFAGAAARLGIWSGHGTNSPMQRILANVADQLRDLSRFNDPRGVYSHCLCALR